MELIEPILVMNWVGGPISATKEALRDNLDEGCDILLLRSIQQSDLEIMVLKRQASRIRTQVREMRYVLKNDYSPLDVMVRRGMGSNVAQKERNAFFPHRAMMRDAKQSKSKAVVQRW